MAKKRETAAPADVENVYTANWRAQVAGAPRRGLWEAPLYTDIHLTGDREQLGPYLHLNTISFGPAGPVKPAIMARVAIHLGEVAPEEMMRVGSKHYHGGDLLDEIAALTALFLRARVQAGPIEREFAEGGDPLGRPVRYGARLTPAAPTLGSQPQIPALASARALGMLDPIASIIGGAPKQTNALMKAARLYQQALWVADSDPASAWQYLVSAVETAADVWDETEIEAETALEQWSPELFALLREKAPDVVGAAAAILARQIRATRKFVNFIVTFAPAPPEKRPTDFLRFDYSPEHIRRAANIVYKHRSNALHGGIGFPLPMCEPPRRFAFDGKDDDAPQEVPIGLGTAARGASWSKDEAPLLLCTFEHIVRGAVLNWWSVTSAPAAAESR